MSSPNPIQPLNLGNVVSAGLRLYRSNFSTYLRVVVKATLWVLLPSLALIAAGIALATIFAPLVALLFLIAIPVYIYCSAKYTAYAGVISRLAFGELINQPETVSAASAHIFPRMWTLWFASFLTGLIAFGVSMGFSIVGAILSGALAIIGSPEPTIAVALLLNGLQIVSFCVQLWMSSRLFIFSLPAVVEEDVDAVKALGRSWNLTKKNAGRVMLIIFVTFLVTSPLFILVGFVAISISLPFFQTATGSLDAILPTIFPLILGFLTLYLLTLMLVTPLWEAIRAVIYYDLRTRREGLGLQLRDRDSLI